MLILPSIMCGGGLRGAEVALHSTRPFVAAAETHYRRHA